MNSIKRMLGVVWFLLGPAIIYLLIHSAMANIDIHGKSDINKPIPWMIIILVFTPIAVGLMMFGYYALKGEYDQLPGEE